MIRNTFDLFIQSPPLLNDNDSRGVCFFRSGIETTDFFSIGSCEIDHCHDAIVPRIPGFPGKLLAQLPLPNAPVFHREKPRNYWDSLECEVQGESLLRDS